MKCRVMHFYAYNPFGRIVGQGVRDGLVVAPMCLDAEEKHPCVKWKEYQTRRPTCCEVQEWVHKYPNRNGLYLLGALYGKIVLDIDDRDAAEWVRDQGVPLTPTVRTRRGWHLHFQHPGFKVSNSAGAIHAGIDIRGDGGIAVAVGSRHATGFVYRWADKRGPEIPIAPAPTWLLDWLRTETRRKSAPAPCPARSYTGAMSAWARAALDREIDALRSAGEGTRNHALARGAFKIGQKIGAGEMPADVVESLYVVAQAWPNFSHSKDTINRQIAEGARVPRGRMARAS